MRVESALPPKSAIRTYSPRKYGHGETTNGTSARHIGSPQKAAQHSSQKGTMRYVAVGILPRWLWFSLLVFFVTSSYMLPKREELSKGPWAPGLPGKKKKMGALWMLNTTRVTKALLAVEHRGSFGPQFSTSGIFVWGEHKIENRKKKEQGAAQRKKENADARCSETFFLKYFMLPKRRIRISGSVGPPGPPVSRAGCGWLPTQIVDQ